MKRIKILLLFITMFFVADFIFATGVSYETNREDAINDLKTLTIENNVLVLEEGSSDSIPTIKQYWLDLETNSIKEDIDFILNVTDTSWSKDDNGNFKTNARTLDGLYIGYSASAIYHVGGKIEEINSNFLSNSGRNLGNGKVYGGAIINLDYNTSNMAYIDNITGDFILNYCYGTTTSNEKIKGGALFNNGYIKNIDGNFIKNYVVSTNSDGYGGAIYNEHDIQNITGNFVDNYLNSKGNAYGGAIYNWYYVSENTKIGSINGDFINNSATSINNAAYGGAICNTHNINNIAGNFINNSANGTSTETHGGAIYNSGIITIEENSCFNSNKALNKTGFSKGGAISNVDNGEIIIKDGVLFSSNVSQGNRSGDSLFASMGGAIYSGYNHDNNSVPKLTTRENVIFEYNRAISTSATSLGGAIVNSSSSTMAIGSNNMFVENKAISEKGLAYGGAIFNESNATITLGDNVVFSSNIAQSQEQGARGGAIQNNGKLTLNSNTNFDSNKAIGTGGVAYGGAICNNGTITEIKGNFENNTSSSNLSSAEGGAIYNTGTIGNIEGDFINNSVSGITGARGGAIRNAGTDATIKSIIGDFIGNSVTSDDSAFGGAIRNEGVIEKITGNFLNNVSSGEGGAIFNRGVLNLVADTSNIEFIGNTANGVSNAIFDDGGTINLWANENKNIIFNDRIKSNNTSTLNINSSTNTLTANGKIILNEDMSGYKGAVNLYGGEIELQAKTEDGSNVNTNKFFNSSINLSSGTLNILNNAIDNITVKNLTTTENTNLKFDTDLSNNTSDNFTVTNSASGELNLSAINILGVDGKIGQITLFNSGKAPTLNILTTANYGGQEYVFTNSDVAGVLNYRLLGYRTFKETINDSEPLVRSYSLDDNELVTENLGQLGGTQLTIFGNGYEVDGNLRAGIIVVSGQTLNIDKGTGEKFVWQNFSSNEGGVIYNKEDGLVQVGDCINFSSNIATHRGGVIFNSTGTITISSSIFSLNTSNHYGGAIYNSSGTVIINSSIFDSNTAITGGAIDNSNSDGRTIIKSTIFNKNTASSAGAISNGGKLIIEDSIFVDNIAPNGAINSIGTVDLIANINNILFTGNTKAINDKRGTINLWASDTASVIFNDRITSYDSSSVLNINKSSGTLPTTGKVILNEDMSGYTGQVNLYGGEIELQAKTEEGSNVNTNKFFSGNINLSSGTLNILNNAIDNITVSNFTSTENANLKFDANLNNNTSDNFTVTNSAEGTLNLTAINILGVNGTSGQITLFKNSKSPTLNILTTANYGGYEYTFTNSGTAGVLNYLLTGYKTLKESVNATSPATRSYSLSEKETVTADLGDLGGTQLTIFGNGYEVDGNGKAGIIVGDGQILNFEGVATIYNFNAVQGGVVFSSNSVVSIETATIFDSNNATASGGVLFACNNSNIKIGSDSLFSSNTATKLGGAIYTGSNSLMEIEDNVEFIDNSAKFGGAIANGVDGTVNIGNEVLFINNRAICENDIAYGGAIYNVGEMEIGSNTIFNSNSGEYGGAIFNKGILNIGDDNTFSSNTAINYGGAIVNMGDDSISTVSTINIGNNAKFINNIAQTDCGGAIVNKGNIVIGENATFEQNSSAGCGGAIYNNRDGNITIGKNVTFSNNAEQENGGAIYTEGIVTLLDGGTFINNTANGTGGAINLYNGGVINLIANTENIEFTGNTANGISNAIHDKNGTINLYASDTNSIIFNDRITSENTSSTLNINKPSGTLPRTGKIVLNEDMSGWVGTTNLYNGNLEITEGNNFINGNFTIHGGTFTANANSIITDFTNGGIVNLTGGTITNNISGLMDGIINIKNNDVTINDDVFVNNNNIKLGTTLKLLNEESLNTSTLTICNGAILNTQNNSIGMINANSILIENGANWTYQLDVDLKSAKADNLINVESVGNGSKATIDDIHLLSDKATKTSIQIADNDIKATIAQDNFKIYTTNLSYGVTTSLDSNLNTLLNIEAIGYGGLANAVYDGANSYSVTEDIDYLTKWIEDPIGTTNNQLKGNLTISNISSNNRVLKSTNNAEGLITEGYTLQINNVSLECFNEAIKVNNANGNLQLTNVKFSSNTGNAVITSSGTVELSGVVFDNTNTATIDIINDNKLILSGSSTTFTTGVIGKGTTTINGVNINLAYAIIEQNKIEINSNGSLTANASNITADIENNSNLIFSEGTNNNYIFGTGTTIIDGEVINSSTIANNVTINSQKQLTTNATNIDGQIENNGDLIFNAGTNDNYIYGDGNVSIEGYVISNSSITQSTVTVASTGKFENNNKLQLIDYINNGTTVNNSTISVSGKYYNVGITTNTNYIKANIYTNKENSVMDNTGLIDADEFNIENGSIFSTSFDNLIIKGDFENDGEVTVKGGEIKNNIIGEGKLIIENLAVNNKDINQSSITINTEATLTNNNNITINQILTNNGQLTNEGNIETEQLNNVANSTITNNSNFTINKKGQNYGRIDGNGILNINDDFDNFSYLRQNLINISSGTFNNENIVISNGINLQEKAKLMSDASNISGNILNAGNVILTGGENNNWIYGTGTTIIDGEVINSSTIVNNVKINETKKLTTSAESINGDILNNGILIINSGKENNNKITGIGKLYINCNLTNNNIIRQKELSLNLNPNIQFASSLNSSDNSSQLSVFTNNSEITVETLNLKDTMLKLTEKGSLAVDNLSSQNSAMDLANSLTQQHNFKTISVTDKLDLAVDVDLKNKTMDTISADIYDEEGNIDINKINIIMELKGNNTEIVFTTSTVLKDKITSITTASSNLFKYNVEYNKNAGTLNFSITAKDNPTMVAGQVANIADGLITQTTVLNQAFSSIDNIRNKITSAKEKGLLYASTADVVFDNSNKLERGLWLRPFYSQESINFDSLSVDNTLTGTLAGIDLVTSENSLVSVYLGYAGSEQKYEDIKVSQTGYIVGATGMLIKDDWYAGLTANINFNKAESQSDYGTDSFDMNMYSVGAKAGYNYEINDKWTLEPNLTLMYGNVNSAEYQTTQGAKVEGQSVANIIVAPQVKGKLGLTNGWQPYGLLGYVINCGDKVKANVEDVEFEQQKIENYFEFGIGINKEFINTPWNCYLQVTGRSGDRSGFDSSLGIKYKF